MRNVRYFLLLLSALLCVSAGIASADYLNIHTAIGCYPNTCDFQNYINGPGSPAQGYAMFPVTTLSGSRWSFNFVTPTPYSWGYDSLDDYYASFGAGGTFQMTGPGDLTLLGQITSGFLFNSNGESWVIDLDFSGRWSNSLDATGQLWINRTYHAAELDVTTGSAPTEAPEPASIALLSGGLSGMLVAYRRWIR